MHSTPPSHAKRRVYDAPRVEPEPRTCRQR
jgi:hypothetical protein